MEVEIGTSSDKEGMLDYKQKKYGSPKKEEEIMSTN